MTLKPAPGVLIIEPTQENQDGIYTGASHGKVIQGKVIAIGHDLVTDNQTYSMKDYGKVGDIVAFLTYEGEYDKLIIGNKTYHAVKIEDMRTRIYGK